MTKKRRWLRRILWYGLLAFLGLHVCAALSLLALKWVDPFTTSVQAQRRIESWFGRARYQKRYAFVPLKKMSPHLPHAVIAAEDGRFYQHHGFDWIELLDTVQNDWEEGRFRGASTISQQLTKNLFLTTRGSVLRKGLEYTITPMTEFILGKQRILELYLNVIEMGPGVYGAEAAAQYHFRSHAWLLNREQCARLAAILPSPRRRRPAVMNNYSAIIQQRMTLLGY